MEVNTVKNVLCRCFVYGLIFGVPLVIIPEILLYLCTNTYKKKLAKYIPKEYDSIVILISPNKNLKCGNHITTKQSCGETCSYEYLNIILNHIRSAKESVSLCMLTVTLWQVFHELVKAKIRGVHVRLLIDARMLYVHATTVGTAYLKTNRIPVKVQEKGKNTLHHKFCLFDEKTPQQVMFSGSSNMTMQGLTANWEHIIFTSDPNVVQQFSNEFEFLWLTGRCP